MEHIESGLRFALTWSNLAGTVICNCVAHYVQGQRSEMSPSSNVIIDKVESCRVEPGGTQMVADFSRLPQSAINDISALIGKQIEVANAVIELGLIQYIESPNIGE